MEMVSRTEGLLRVQGTQPLYFPRVHSGGSVGRRHGKRVPSRRNLVVASRFLNRVERVGPRKSLDFADVHLAIYTVNACIKIIIPNTADIDMTRTSSLAPACRLEHGNALQSASIDPGSFTLNLAKDA